MHLCCSFSCFLQFMRLNRCPLNAEFFVIVQMGRDLSSTIVARMSELIVAIVVGYLLTYVFAAIGWFVLREFRYGFGDQPNFSSDSFTFRGWVLLVKKPYIFHSSLRFCSAFRLIAFCGSVQHFDLGQRDGPTPLEDWYTSDVTPWYYFVISITYFIFIIVIQSAVVQVRAPQLPSPHSA